MVTRKAKGKRKSRAELEAEAKRKGKKAEVAVAEAEGLPAEGELAEAEGEVEAKRKPKSALEELTAPKVRAKGKEPWWLKRLGVPREKLPKRKVLRITPPRPRLSR